MGDERPHHEGIHRDKRLYLLRHAKSAWDDPELADHDRPLTDRGQQATVKLCAHLKRLGKSPALVLCSSAQRARETLEGISPALSPSVSVLVEPGLYAATGAELLERLRELPETVPSAMVIGHNPGLHDLALSLIGRGDRSLRRQLREKFPTAALATLAVGDMAWRDLTPGQATLIAYVGPRQLA